jgi:tetratricopeptide (TPR) repeat protein
MSLPTQSEPPKDRAFPQSGMPASARQRRGIRPLTWILLLAIIGSCTVQQVPSEVGRWHLARAIRQRENGLKEAAHQELAAAIERFPTDPSLLLRRAEWQLADGNREKALADADRSLETAAGGSAANTYRWLSLHALFLQNLGEFSRAVEDWKRIESLSERSGIPDRAMALNGLAYAQALAKIELDEALNNANQALELHPGSSAILDTRGFIHFLRGDHESALADLDEAVQKMDREAELTRRLLVRRQEPPEFEKIIQRATLRTLSELEPQTEIDKLASSARSTAVGHYHRSLVLVVLGKKEAAASDLAIVRKLIGRAPDATLF